MAVAATVGQKTISFSGEIGGGWAPQSAHWVHRAADLSQTCSDGKKKNAYIHTLVCISHGSVLDGDEKVAHTEVTSTAEGTHFSTEGKKQAAHYMFTECAGRVCIVSFNGRPVVSSESESCRHRPPHNTDKAEWDFLLLLWD